MNTFRHFDRVIIRGIISEGYLGITMEINEVECLIRMNQFMNFGRKQRFSLLLRFEITRYSFGLNARKSLF